MRTRWDCQTCGNNPRQLRELVKAAKEAMKFMCTTHAGELDRHCAISLLSSALAPFDEASR